MGISITANAVILTLIFIDSVIPAMIHIISIILIVLMLSLTLW